MAHTPDNPQRMLVQKLGLATPSKTVREVVVLNAPEGFIESISPLDGHIVLRRRLDASIWMVIAFVRTPADLEALMVRLREKLPVQASAWIVRPKAQHNPGFNENDVRAAVLSVGMVDYKICSVDADWSGVKVTWRRGQR